MNDQLVDYNLLVVGKTGSGKSTACNQLLASQGSRVFHVYKGMEGQTDSVQCEIRQRGNLRLHIIDTPDVFNMGLDEINAERQFREWERLVPPTAPTAVLCTVRLDVRFTPHDYQLYQNYRNLLPARLRNNLILAFTRVGELQGRVEDEVKLSTVKTLLNDAQGRYVTFSADGGYGNEAEINGDKIIDWMTKMSLKPVPVGVHVTLLEAVTSAWQFLQGFFKKHRYLCLIGGILFLSVAAYSVRSFYFKSGTVPLHPRSTHTDN